MYGNTAELAPDAAAAQDVRNAVKALNEAMERAKDFGLRVDAAAAQDVRNAVKALNEAIERAKDFGLRVDVDQITFNPRRVVVKIWKNM